VSYIRIQINDEWQSLNSSEHLIKFFEKERKLKGLCSHQCFEGMANCGLCLVEVENETATGTAGRRELQPACRLLPVSGMKVWSHSSKALNYRQSVLSLFLSQLPRDGFLKSQKLLEAFTLIAQYSGLGFIFPKLSPREKLKTEKVQNGLHLIPEICIGCGLCIDFTKKDPNNQKRAPELIIKNNQVRVSFPEEVSPLTVTSLSLYCPTGALVSERQNSLHTNVMPLNQNWVLERGEYKIIARTNGLNLQVHPHDDSPFIPEDIYPLLDRYQPGLAFEEKLRNKRDWSKKKLTWFLGRNQHQNISHDLKKMIDHRRESVHPLFPDQTLPSFLTEQKPWTQGSLGLSFVIILGPEDQLTRAIIENCVKLTESTPALIMLSRYDQLSPKLMQELKEQGVIFAPIFDWLEQGMDTRFPRHHAHTWSCLNL